MIRTLPQLGRRGILAAAAGLLALAGALLFFLALSGQDGPPQPSTDRPAVAALPPVRAATETAKPTPIPVAPPVPAAPATDFGPVLPASEPVALDIPSIGVHSTHLVPLAVGADGVLPAPTDFASPGWYTGGPTPGQLGPAVIAGHVDSKTGPAIFYRLGQLAAGAKVTVTRKDGSTATFTVDSVARYAKADFPTAKVYGNTTDRAELRLITCGGAFDRSTGHYVDNIVAFGHLT